MPSNAPLRTIALLEGAKGVLVLVAGLGLLGLIHRDVEAIAEALVRDARLNPASHFPRLFLEASGKVDDQRLIFLARFALIYAFARLAEAYGLWHQRPWGEWLGALVGGLYLPLEIRLLLQGFTMLHLLVFAGNLVIVGYLLWRIVVRRRRLRAALHPAGGATAIDG